MNDKDFTPAAGRPVTDKSPAAKGHVTDKSAAGGPPDPSREPHPEWLKEMKKYEAPSVRRASVQLLDTLPLYFALLVIMYLTISRDYPYWVTLLLALPAGGFLVRLFVIFHDCCHGSYLPSRGAMKIVGTLLGALAFTPFEDWRHAHGIHHSTAGNLDRRGVGDVWTMTLEEYTASSRRRKMAYRLFRNPLIMFGIGPLYSFLVAQRFPGGYSSKKDRRSVLLTNFFILSIIAAAVFTIGPAAYIKIQLPVIFFAGLGGVWLFYVQHQFDPTYWARTDDWGSLDAAMRGSSCYRLPAVLRWFSANIGLHHIHHLRPRIPNYNLKRCMDETPEVQLKNPLTIGKSLRSLRMNLWDEVRGRLVSFREAARG
jgi:omega-6 fatty acid desaturase (delta-12 desaturase)